MISEGLLLENWQVALLSDTLHDLELDEELRPELQEILEKLDYHIVIVRLQWELLSDEEKVEWINMSVKERIDLIMRKESE